MQIQKLINIKHLLITLSFMTMFISCQKEHIDINEPDKNISISANDNIADLILKMVLKDGSFDNIIDRCSEISIKFPYSILINDQLLDINSEEDIKVIKLNYFQFRDDIEINYPVTVSYSDYSESVLNNADELERIQEQYNTNLSDDDIECINFIYPIEITLYNTLYQNSDFIVADDDYGIYNIFSDMDNLIIEMNFPILIEALNQNTITINNNIELENEIEKIIGSCDEEDEVDFSDEDYPYDDLLTSKKWQVSLYSDTTVETSSFSSYIFEFRSDYTIQVETGTEIIYGVWELIFNTNMVLEIEFDTDKIPLVWLNHGWMIKNKSSNLIEMETEIISGGFTKKLNLSVPE